MGYGKIWNLICVIRHRSKNKFILTILKTTKFFLYAASTGSSPYWPQVRVAHTRRQKTWTHVVLFQANPYQPYWPLIVAIQSLEEQLGASLLRFFNQGHLVTSASWAWAILCLDPGSSTACLLSAAITLSHSLLSHLKVVGCITSHQLQQLYHSLKVSLDCAGTALSSLFLCSSMQSSALQAWRHSHSTSSLVSMLRQLASWYRQADCLPKPCSSRLTPTAYLHPPRNECLKHILPPGASF